MNPINHPIIWKFQKNEQILRSVLMRDAPKFVYQRRPRTLDGEIPVFTFHAVEPDEFEAQCRHLADNGYHTLSLDEWAAAMRGETQPPPKSVFITFDDGLKQVWTVAYPLLQKYGLKATCFLIPGIIPEEAGPVRPNLADVWRGEADLDAVLDTRPGNDAVASWAENRMMHESGVVQFQSHTLNHGLVFTDSKIFDFFNPRYDAYFYGNVNVPIYRRDGRDVPSRDPLPGMPIYWAKPRMQAERRFFDDERIRDACVECVEREGAESFFADKTWRRRLTQVVDEQRSKGRNGREGFETIAERDAAVREELQSARDLIEAKLPGRAVTHLCFPWFEAEPFAARVAHATGHEALYYGQLPGRRTNRPGDGLAHVVRADEMFVQRLPGVGREPLHRILARRYHLTGGSGSGRKPSGQPNDAA